MIVGAAPSAAWGWASRRRETHSEREVCARRRSAEGKGEGREKEMRRALLRHRVGGGGVAATLAVQRRCLRASSLSHASTSASSDRTPGDHVVDEQKDPAAMYHLGMKCYIDNDSHTGKHWLKQAAEKGHPQAMAALGSLVFEEMEALRALSQAHDYQAYKEAERWLARASARGELQATRTLLRFHASHGNVFPALGTFFTFITQVFVRR